ncbi:MAG: diaminopimelate epimerase [Bryobacteraceae bacterium]
MIIPFIKAHGAGNDFLFTFASHLPAVTQLANAQLASIARAICHRNTGIGADGWYLIEMPPDPGGAGLPRIRLWNSDGSYAGLSGNGTRCVAAILASRGLAGDPVRILTGAGERILHRRPPESETDRSLWFEMEMGAPQIGAVRFPLPLAAGEREVTILDVGNPQCVLAVEEFPPDWTALAAEIEGHPHFPSRTNVSLIRALDPHTIEARFYERGAGHTLSSGTGSTGAAAAAILLDLVKSPVTVRTEFGPLYIRTGEVPITDGGTVWLTGPAEEIGTGQFLFLDADRFALAT